MKKLFFFCFLASSFSTSLFPMARDNELHSFAEANFRQMCQAGSHKAIHIIIHLNYKKPGQTLVVADKDETCIKKDDAAKK